MIRTTLLALVLFGLHSPVSVAQETVAGAKLVLLELFTSQGCSSCPAAEKMIGDLPSLGIDPARVAPLAFHVDYFNDPWRDRFSSELYSQREWQYSTLYNKSKKVGKPDYLYFTPMLMVDGRVPMLGSDREKASKAIKQAIREKPGLDISLKWGLPKRARGGDLVITLSRPRPQLADQEILVGTTVYEEPVTTQVGSGENSGRLLTEHFVVRSLDVKTAVVRPSQTTELRIPLDLEEGWIDSHCGVTVYAQDEKTGRIHQAATLKWNAPMEEKLGSSAALTP